MTTTTTERIALMLQAAQEAPMIASHIRWLTDLKESLEIDNRALRELVRKYDEAEARQVETVEWIQDRLLQLLKAVASKPGYGWVCPDAILPLPPDKARWADAFHTLNVLLGPSPFDPPLDGIVTKVRELASLMDLSITDKLGVDDLPALLTDMCTMVAKANVERIVTPVLVTTPAPDDTPKPRYEPESDEEPIGLPTYLDVLPDPKDDNGGYDF